MYLLFLPKVSLFVYFQIIFTYLNQIKYRILHIQRSYTMQNHYLLQKFTLCKFYYLFYILTYITYVNKRLQAFVSRIGRWEIQAKNRKKKGVLKFERCSERDWNFRTRPIVSRSKLQMVDGPDSINKFIVKRKTIFTTLQTPSPNKSGLAFKVSPVFRALSFWPFPSFIGPSAKTLVQTALKYMLVRLS